jgi:hypothetical protein
MIWTRNPDAIALEGVLRLKELQDRPLVAWHFADPEAIDVRRPRSGPVLSLGYEIFIHINHIIIFRPPSASVAEWPMRHSFHWRLGYRGDWTRAPPHRGVKDRLGPHKRDRSPSDSVGRDLSQHGDRSTKPRHHGPSSLGPCQQKCQWVIAKGPRGAGNTSVAMQGTTGLLNGRPNCCFFTKDTLVSQPKPMSWGMGSDR